MACARRRVALGQARHRAHAGVGFRDEKGGIAHDTLDDELVPQVSEETLAARARSPTLGPTWNIEKTGETAGRAYLNVNTPKRGGEPLSGPGPQRADRGSNRK